tara:strand:- start:993 stop:2096 length:1104 start_codon:yes stop_codon:yes gene_type:complete
MKKIIIVAPKADTIINFRENLIEDIQKRNFEVITISPAPINQYKDIFHKKSFLSIFINFKNNRINPLKDFNLIIKLFRIFKKESPSIILSYAIKPIIWSGFLSKYFNTSFYALITGVGFTLHGTSLKRKILKKIVIFLYRISLKNSKAVIFQNNDNLNLFIEENIIPKSKTFLVNGSGVDTSKFDAAPLPLDGISFLCIARLLGEKGLREYAAAAKIVKKEYSDVKFNLLGSLDTSFDAISIDEIKSWSDYINYQGLTTDVRPYLKKTHVFVLPSYHEGIPKSTLEAMSMGRAILTTDAVGCKETVKNDLNGFKVPVGSVDKLVEKMRWFITHSEKIKTMGIESRRMVEEKFDVKKVNLKIMEIMGI